MQSVVEYLTDELGERLAEWSAAHNLLLSAGADGLVRRHRGEIHALLWIPPPHEARAVHISSDGKNVASCGEDGVIQLWDMQSHQHLATLRALGTMGAEHATPPRVDLALFHLVL